jgi:hypothetical protein
MMGFIVAPVLMDSAEAMPGAPPFKQTERISDEEFLKRTFGEWEWNLRSAALTNARYFLC